MKKEFDASFKAMVAIEAIKGKESLSSLATRFDLSEEMITEWKNEFLLNASSVFGQSTTENHSHEKERMRLHRKIEVLEAERDFVVDAAKKLGVPTLKK